MSSQLSMQNSVEQKTQTASRFVLMFYFFFLKRVVLFNTNKTFDHFLKSVSESSLNRKSTDNNKYLMKPPSTEDSCNFPLLISE